MDTVLIVVGIAVLILNIVLIIKFFDLCRNVEELTGIAREAISRYNGQSSDSSVKSSFPQTAFIGNGASRHPPTNKRSVRLVDIIVCVVISLIILIAIVNSISH